ncbi:K(+)/H(+) antiporter 1 [Apiospora arundinis]|uniref:K(+)/H(+) antiporter 1 n=1 Tax=Apiospora arundinis TaxID=335852 RepID=A0ABR2JIN4_9PEZI
MSSAGDGNRATPQGGVLEGSNPSHYNPTDPLTIFIIQAGLILILCHLLHWPLSKIRQPRVIAEVIGGILLGPSVMGRIPGFKNAIFPDASIPNLTLVANIGLVLYLFSIGLETDVAFLLSNWRVATSVAVGGLVLPFAVGCGLAWGIYHQFADDVGVQPIAFSTYMLFVGVAIAITAFPVLCRILTELKLLETSVGVITLSAGVANDVVGWVLLALCVALANAGNGLTALWILLCCLGYMLFLMYAVKPVLTWVLRRTGNIDNGPSQSAIGLVLLVALASAFFTAIIGVHAIFGGFMVGLILPRERNFNVKVIEKLEDLIGAILLPLYFTLSGLKTNIGLLDNGITWGYVIAVTFTAFFTKVMGATLASRLNGLVWRESFTIGALMSCKGLVELIVLNIGLQAKILSTRTFTIFVVMALLTTFATTPLVSWLYPPWYQKKIAAWKRGEIDWDTGATLSHLATANRSTLNMGAGMSRVNSMLVYLRLDNMPDTLNLLYLFGMQSDNSKQQNTEAAESKESETSVTPAGNSNSNKKNTVRTHGMRLLQLGDRDSNVLTVSQVDEYTRNDSVVNIFRTVGQFLKIAVSGEVAVMPQSRFAEALLAKASDTASDLLLVPWTGTGALSDSSVETADDKVLSASYLQFASNLLASRDHNVALFLPHNPKRLLPNDPPNAKRHDSLSRTHSFKEMHHGAAIPSIPVMDKSYHIFFPFFGGADDEVALSLVIQLCEASGTTATIVQFTDPSTSGLDVAAIVASRDRAAAKITTDRVHADKGAEAALIRALSEIRSDDSTQGRTNWYNLVVLGRSHHEAEAGSSSSSSDADARHCLGDTAAKFVASSDLNANILVVQARSTQ